MTIEDGGYEISVRVVSELVEKIFLNIPADWLNKALGNARITSFLMSLAGLNSVPVVYPEISCPVLSRAYSQVHLHRLAA